MRSLYVEMPINGELKTKMENAKITTEIRVADHYRKGCPTNRCGRRVGYGVTSKGAIADCIPWANQAPWLVRRTRQVLLTDGSDQNFEVLWDALSGFENSVPGLLTALTDKKWSEAVRLSVAAGLLK